MAEPAERPASPGDLSWRRRFGLDRSGPEPPQTRSGQPLRPFTLPNAVGLLRLAGIPVFLVLAFNSGDGRDLTAGLLFLAISAGDYLDGFLARSTGQYSRLGALMDPVVDRLNILAGAAVCWHFHLLPRWALAILALRELVTLLLAQWGLRRGVDVSVNWAGRIAVFPVMGSIGLSLLVDTVLSEILLISGVALALFATGLYARTGIRAVRSQHSAS